MKTPQQVLLDAADDLEKNGWWSGKPLDAMNNCTLTAINAVTPFPNGWDCSTYIPQIPLREEARKLLIVTAGIPCPGTSCEAIVDWNDAEGQTAENVIATMRKAAKL